MLPLLTLLLACPSAHQAAPSSPPWIEGEARIEAPAGGSMATLTGVAVTADAEQQRITLSLDGGTGAWARWLDQAPVRCGSGQPVEVQGAAVLLLTLQPARAHDDAGAMTAGTTSLAPALAQGLHLVQTCDYEGEVSWAVGAQARTALRLQADAGAVVLDLKR